MLNNKRLIVGVIALLATVALLAASQSQAQETAQDAALPETRAGYAIQQFQAGNEAAAIRFLIQLAYQGDVAAQFNLGVINLDRDDRVAGEHEATFWFLKAATAGDVSAQFNLGMLLLRAQPTLDEPSGQASVGAPKEPGGLEWLERAAEGGKLEAQTNFGIYTAFDDPEQIGIAKSWLRLAADAGDQSATDVLGLLAQPASVTPLRSLLHPLDLKLRAEVDYGLSEVLADQARIYSMPLDGRNPIGMLSRGDSVEVIAKDSGWVQVRLLRGLPVWVQERNIKRTDGRAVVNRLEASLYLAPDSAPATNKLGTATKGEALRIVKDDQDWLLVEAPLRFAGWIRESDVNVRVSSTAPATADVPRSDPAIADDLPVPSPRLPDGEGTSGKQLTVFSDGVVLAEPNAANAPLGLIRAGTVIDVAKEQDEFSFSERMPRSGWIYGKLIEVSRMPSGESRGTGASNRTGARVRMGPNLQTAIIERLTQGQGVQIIDSVGSWYQIALQPSPGWIASALLNDDAATRVDAKPEGASAQDTDATPNAAEAAANPQYVTVAADSIVYSDPVVTSPARGRLSEPTSAVNPTGSVGRGLAMLAVPAASALYGWVFGELIEVKSPIENGQGQGTINSNAVRIRFDPTTERDNIIGSFPRGAQVKILGVEGDWLKVALPPAAGFVVVVTE